MQRKDFLKIISRSKISVLFVMALVFCSEAHDLKHHKKTKTPATSPYVSNIYTALGSNVSDVKIRALEIIALYPSKFSATKVKPLLQDKDNDVKIKASIALSHLGDTSGLLHLRNLAKSKVTISDTPTVSERLRYFSAQNLRIKAILALGDARDIGFVNTLLELTKDADARVVDAAWISLAKLGNKKGVDVFISGLKSHEKMARAKSAEVLGDLEVVEAIPQIRERLNDWDKDTKVSAIKALGKLKDFQSVSKFKDLLLTAKEQSVREAAAIALGRVGDKSSIEFLKRFTQDEHGVVRFAVCEALSMLGDYSGKDFILFSAQKASEKEIRYRAIRTLANFPLESGDIKMLEEFTRDPDGLLAVEASAVLLKFEK